MNLISVKTGKVNAAMAVSECYVFYAPRPATEGESKVEEFLGKAARSMRGLPNAIIKEHGSAVVVPSLSDMPAEVGGMLASASYQIQDGVILKVYVKRRIGWSGVMKHAMLFVKSREHAAHRMLKFRPVANNALTMDWLGLQGRFDIISLQEAQAFGALINPATLKLAGGSDPELIECITLEEETLAPVGFVETASGKLVPQLKRRRKIESI